MIFPNNSVLLFSNLIYAIIESVSQTYYYLNPESPITDQVIEQVERFERMRCEVIEEISAYIQDLLGVIFVRGFPIVPPPIPVPNFRGFSDSSCDHGFPPERMFRDPYGRLVPWFDMGLFPHKLLFYFDDKMEETIAQIQEERSRYCAFFAEIRSFLSPDYAEELVERVRRINLMVLEIMQKINDFREKIRKL